MAAKIGPEVPARARKIYCCEGCDALKARKGTSGGGRAQCLNADMFGSGRYRDCGHNLVGDRVDHRDSLGEGIRDIGVFPARGDGYFFGDTPHRVRQR
jgi:hypothetical protein